VVDRAHSDPSHEIRVLPDGRMLNILVADGSAMLYPSREAFEQALQLYKEAEAEARKGPFDPAKELLPPLDDFLRDVETHAKSLGKVLHIPDEALDRSVESIDLVDKALRRVKIAKRMTPEVFTPVTAYLGEVMRLVCDGRWGKLPASIKRTFPVYDPVEWKRYAADQHVAGEASLAAANKAHADAKARRESEYRASAAYENALTETRQAVASVPEPKPIRYREYDEPVAGHEHEPVIWERDGRTLHPVASVVKTLTERSTYGSLRVAVEGHLARYLSAKRKAAAAARGRP
jgi:hypothetical protein